MEKYDGHYDKIPLYTKGDQKVTLDDETKSVILENSDSMRSIEISESTKTITIKNTDPATIVEIDSVGVVKFKGTIIEIEGADVMINGVSLVTFMDAATSFMAL